MIIEGLSKKFDNSSYSELLNKETKNKFLISMPLFLISHFLIVYFLSSIIENQAAFFGVFFIGFFTWHVGIYWGLLFAILVGFITGLTLIAKLNISAYAINNYIGAFGYFSTVAIISYVSRMHHSLKLTKKQLEIEHEKTELLMANILPISIAERLKKGDSLIADRYTESTILFCDIVGFTKFSHDHSPEEMVGVLDNLISSFDKLTEKLGLEKIKTIGDAYLVVCGLPEKRIDHAVAIGNMALEMRDVIEDLNKKNELNFKIRIGIHSGPVIGGVIGTKKFTFDIWGDTVNVASRLESHGIPGEIQVSRETYLLLKDSFLFEKRGEIELKNRGAISTWLLKEKLG